MPKKLQPARRSAKQPAKQPADDPLGGLAGSLLGGSSGDALGGLLGGLLGGSQAGGRSGQAAGGDLLGGLLGGLLAGGQQGGGAGDNPLVKSIADGLAAKIGISPQIAETVVALVLGHLAGGQGAVATKSMRKGKVSRKLVQDTGLVGQLSAQTGLDSDTAAASVNHVFQALGAQMTGG